MAASALRRFGLPAAFSLVGIAILVGLGVWQLQRLAWKEGLIARVEGRLAASPGPAPSPSAWPSIDLAELEYEPVTLAGHFLNDHEAHVIFALTEPKGRYGGFGYMVVTPFASDGGWIVYVNRGFVPTEKADPAARPGTEISGETTVVGLLRQPYRRTWFMPGDDPVKNQWISRDPVAFAKAAGLPVDKLAPYLIDADFDKALPGGLPQGGETTVTFPNNHLEYALTWFGLAIGLAAVATIFLLRRMRE